MMEHVWLRVTAPTGVALTGKLGVRTRRRPGDSLPAFTFETLFNRQPQTQTSSRSEYQAVEFAWAAGCRRDRSGRRNIAIDFGFGERQRGISPFTTGQVGRFL